MLFRAVNNINIVIRNCRLNTVRSLSMAKPVLYGDEVSPPARFVMMTAHILDIDLDFQKIDLFKRENRTESYKKINPLQKIPALSHNGTNMVDSHAIALYLCQLKNDQNLYPEDPIQRAKINQMLFFNSGTLFPLDSELLSKYFMKSWPVENEKIEEWYRALDFLEHHLQDHKWLTGEKMHLCDICLVTVVTSTSALVPLTKRHAKVEQWIKNFESLPFYEINKNGVSILSAYIEAMK